MITFWDILGYIKYTLKKRKKTRLRDQTALNFNPGSSLTHFMTLGKLCDLCVCSPPINGIRE